MKTFSNIVDRIKAWYRGQYVERENDPHSPVYFLVPGYYKQPLPARILRRIGRWMAANWHILITALLAILAILVNILLHRRQSGP